MILYPMNALVNDQLGRLRLLFGNNWLSKQFETWAGRPIRFARYTSRTLYPGVRDPKKDADRLSPIGKYYVKHLQDSLDPSSPNHVSSKVLVEELKSRGKWPAKPDLLAWYGKPSSRWQDSKTKAFKRCVTLPHDQELFTRHEVQAAPPDVLVTNYSMLEYMLMRPLERPIFDHTREWLSANPKESFLLVIDEAHLYRGAQGSEVALLIRRLRQRLGIEPDRLQIICTTASFHDHDYAPLFGAQLTGKHADDFRAIKGDLDLRKPAHVATQADASLLAGLDLAKLDSELASDRDKELSTFCHALGKAFDSSQWQLSLFEALSGYPPLNLLVNQTMKQALPVKSLGEEIFQDSPQVAAKALTALTRLGSYGPALLHEPGLLPCRVHSFYRGLPGLWVCMDPNCYGCREGCNSACRSYVRTTKRSVRLWLARSRTVYMPQLRNRVCACLYRRCPGSDFPVG